MFHHDAAIDSKAKEMWRRYMQIELYSNGIHVKYVFLDGAGTLRRHPQMPRRQETTFATCKLPVCCLWTALSWWSSNQAKCIICQLDKTWLFKRGERKIVPITNVSRCIKMIQDVSRVSRTCWKRTSEAQWSSSFSSSSASCWSVISAAAPSLSAWQSWATPAIFVNMSHRHESRSDQLVILVSAFSCHSKAFRLFCR